MNRAISRLIILAACVASGCSTTTVEQVAQQPSGPRTERYWFPRLIDPPKVDVCLPDNFAVYSATPEYVKSEELYDMVYGVLWTDPQTGEKYENVKKKSFKKLKEPLFWVRLSTDVAQIPGTNNFTCEQSIKSFSNAANLRNVKTEKRKWGDYPLLIWTGERPSGPPVRAMWIGLNSPDGWALLVDYRMPGEPAEKRASCEKIWTDFIEKTVESDSAAAGLLRAAPEL